MVHSQILSSREKKLALIAVAILVIFGIVGYTKNSAASSTSVLVAGEGTVNEQDRKNQQQNLRDNLNNLTYTRTEIKDIKREAKGADTSKVESLLSQVEACYNGLQTSVGMQDFWNKQNECNSLRQDIDSEMRPLRDQRSCAQKKTNIESRRKEKKQNIDTQRRDIQRNDKNANLTEVDGIISQIDVQLAKADPIIASGQCTDDTLSTLTDVEAELNSAFSSVYSTMNELNQAANEVRQKKDNANDIKNKRQQCKDMSRQLKDFERESKGVQIDSASADSPLALVQGLYRDMCDASTGFISRMEAAVTSGDVTAYNDARSEFDGNNNNFFTTINEARNSTQTVKRGKEIGSDIKGKRQQCKDSAREFKNFDREFAKAEKAGTVSDEDKAGYQTVKDISAQMCDAASGSIAKMEAAVKAQDVDAFDEARSEFDNNQGTFWNAMNEVRGKVGEVRQKQETLKSVTQDLKYKQRDLRRMKSQLKSIKRQYESALKRYTGAAERKQILEEFKNLTVQAEELITKIEAGMASAEREAAEDPDSYWFDHNEELNEYQGEFNELQERIQTVGQTMKELKGLDRELKNREREIPRFDADLQPVLQDLIKRARENLDLIWTTLIKDPEGAESAIIELRQIGQDWDEEVSGE